MTVHNILEKHPRAHPSMACGDKTSDWSFTQSLKDLWKHLRERQKQRKQRRIDRDAFRSMIMLDETQLKDIGINREDVLWAANLPLHENASQALDKIRSENIGRARTRATKRSFNQRG